MKRYCIICFALFSLTTMIWAEELLGNKAKPDPTLQEQAIVPDAGYSFQVGDTIIINKAYERYLTGEKMSTWVYYVRHMIGQVGGKRFPNGILIKGINSWVGPEELLLVSAREKTPQAIVKVEEDKPLVEERIEEIKQMPQEQQEAIAQQAQDFEDTTPLVPAPVDTVAADTVARTPAVVIVTEPEAIYNVTGEPEKQKVDRFTIGLRGGMASLLHKTNNDGKWNVGWDVLLDLQYAHYWKKTDEKPLLGIIVGLSAGYSRSHLSSKINDQYSVETSSGQIDYTITADNVKEYDGQIQLEVPIMFSMITKKGFFLNVGPRFAMPVYSQYDQKIVNPQVNAYFPEEGVNVPNELITGVVAKDKANTSGKWESSKINIMLSAELGYEWFFKNRNSLGLGVYANYSVYTLYTHKAKDQSVVSLTEPDAATPSYVNVVSSTDTYAKGMGYFDLGVKIAYHFNWWNWQK